MPADAVTAQCILFPVRLASIVQQVGNALLIPLIRHNPNVPRLVKGNDVPGLPLLDLV